MDFVIVACYQISDRLRCFPANMLLCEFRLALVCLSSYLPSAVSECSHQFKSLVGQSPPWRLSLHHSPSNSALTLGALILLIAFIMIPKKYWGSPSSALSPDSSAPSSLAKNYKSENGQLQGTPYRTRKVWWIALATTVLFALILGLGLGLTLGREHHDGSESGSLGPIVDLGYSAYQGNTYSDGVSQWLGIRYAAPPTGDLRFAAPQNPIENSTLQKAIKVRLE